MKLDGRDLRDALGRFATGVCLVTTVAKSNEPMAITVNSFSSASLDPPLVLWSLQNNSDVFDVYSDAQRFAINVLSDKQQALCSRYARKGDHSLEAEHYSLGQHGAPLVHGALVSFECSLTTTYPAGDHLIIIGRIDSMHVVRGGDPLLFCGGAFRRLAEAEPTQPAPSRG